MTDENQEGKTVEQQIEEWAQLQFSEDDIQFALDIDVEKFDEALDDDTHPWTIAIRRGRLKAEASVRKSILTMAQQGSTPAQKQFIDIIEKAAKMF
jgi:hypothetical protein